ncbi:hypothetical protein DFH11DRAFT_1550161 [Phellopilus nigrolimitatus]|nr:hypothetical protein DFH11DRAFT_1550161 [Phellopilus nigrolimitatus]
MLSAYSRSLYHTPSAHYFLALACLPVQGFSKARFPHAYIPAAAVLCGTLDVHQKCRVRETQLQEPEELVNGEHEKEFMLPVYVSAIYLCEREALGAVSVSAPPSANGVK